MKVLVNCSTVLLIIMFSSAARAFVARTPLVFTAEGGAAAAATSAGQCISSTTGTCLASTATDTTATTTNAWLQYTDLPKFASIEPEQLTDAVDAVVTQVDKEFTQLEESVVDSTVSPEFDTVVSKIEQIQYPLSYVWGVAGHMNGVKNSDTLRTAYEINQPKIIQLTSKFSQSKPIYDALSVIAEQWNTNIADEESKDQSDIPTLDITKQQKRAVLNSLRDMKFGGVGLEGKEKERFNEIRMKLAQLSTTFSNNVLDETKAFGLIVTDSTKLAGTPISARAMWSNSYATYMNSQEPKDGETKVSYEPDPENGPYRITLDGPSLIAALSHVPDREVREQVYMANIQRASEKNPEKNNVPICLEILQLKKEMALLLGFNNYAEYSLASKMAPSIKSVEELAELIRDKALPAAEKELIEITEYARANGGDDYSESAVPKLQPFDITYWSERLKESKFNLTEEETRPYFALPAVLDGLYTLVSRIFNIRVEQADGTTDVWHPDVRFFKVFDKDTNEHIASFFLDPYSRPENKRGGAWMDTCIGKSSAVGNEVPVAYMVCNGSPPDNTKNQPSLMTFREVETLFHEFGHALQHMLTKVSVGDVAGINGIEWDAVELPSQFMENWCYDKKTIYGFAKHWQTNEPMPDEMFTKLNLQKTYNVGMMNCRQLLFGQLDMELHSTFDPTNVTDGMVLFDIHRTMAEKYTPYNMPLPQDRFLCAFSHIFAGGYAAGYYSYKWAEVMSADAYGAFEEVDTSNDELVQEVGMKFRNTVLSYGGAIDPMTVFKSFRGRQPTPDALLRHSGLA
jgi:oligopeptidase A